MPLKNLFITGSTGNIGACLLDVLHVQYRNKLNVIAGCHQAEPNETVSIKSKSNQVMDIDYDDPLSVEICLRNVDILFLVPPPSRNREQQCLTIVKIALKMNVSYIVLVSLLGSESRAGLFCSQFRNIELGIEATKIPFTFLQCSPLQQNMIPFSLFGGIGTIAMPIGMQKYAPIHVNDVARCAVSSFFIKATCIMDPMQHHGQKYRLTGPELLSGVEIAGKASLGLKIPVGFTNCNVFEAREIMTIRSSPKSKWAIQGFMEIYELISRGFFAHVSPDVAKLNFFKGITCEEFFTDNRDYFIHARNTEAPHPFTISRL